MYGRLIDLFPRHEVDEFRAERSVPGTDQVMHLRTRLLAIELDAATTPAEKLRRVRIALSE